MKCGAAAVQGSEASWKEEDRIEVENIPLHTPPLLSPQRLPSAQHPHSFLYWDILAPALSAPLPAHGAELFPCYSLWDCDWYTVLNQMRDSTGYVFLQARAGECFAAS